MKKLICIALVLSMVSVSVLGLTQPVYAAADDDSEFGTILLVSLGIGALVGIIVAFATMGDDEEAAEKQAAYYQGIAYTNNARVKKWTYDDMLLELGKPTDVTEGDKIKIAVYDKRMAKTETNTEYESATLFSNATAQSQSNTLVNGVVWTYSFDKTTKKLLKWKYENYSNSYLQKTLSGPK